MKVQFNNVDVFIRFDSGKTENLNFLQLKELVGVLEAVISLREAGSSIEYSGIIDTKRTSMTRDELCKEIKKDFEKGKESKKDGGEE